MTTWLLLHYKLPNKPSALRVYIWRKLKRLGAILLQDTVWVLPEMPRTTEQIQWLTAEIQEMGGNAYYWKANALLTDQEGTIVQQFNEQVDVIYSDLLKRMEKTRADLQEISQEYQEAASKDFFHSELGKRVREKLTSKRGEKQ
ncbi:MAG TPA: Chromate resistance protein ChrB [Anaerolineales bacterium]|nr:Chromate resistance protein ChrB [Anaerolineales bacterium]